jgi:hypothetical protein
LARVERSGADERSKRIERLFEWPIVIAAILVIPVIYIEQSEHGEPWSTLATVANWVIWLLFLAEVVVMLAVVPDRRRWARTHPLELAIVVLTPPLPSREHPGGRARALWPYLRRSNRRRPHSSGGDRPPSSRVSHLRGQHS